MNKVVYCLLAMFLLCQSCDHAMTEGEALRCLDDYISKTSKMEVYSTVRKGLIDSLTSWKERKLAVDWWNPATTVLDSAIFFNEGHTRCIFLLVDSLDTNGTNHWNDVKTMGGELIDDKWHYYHVSFTTLGYNLKSNGYKNFSFEYLSKDSRLDIISRGFFKPGTCDIDWNFVDSDQWFADWVREKHRQFLNGRGQH